MVASILDLAHLDADAEREHKRLIVERGFRKVGIDQQVPLPLPVPHREGSRARIQLRLDSAGRFIMYARGSHDAVEPPVEQMARAAIAAVVPAVEAWFRAHADLAAFIERVELRTNDDRVVLGLTPKRRKSIPSRRLEGLVECLGPGGAVAVGNRAVAGEPRLDFLVGEVSLGFSPKTFFQVNPDANRQIVSLVRGWMSALQPEHVLDLFAGAGNLSIPLAVDGAAVTLVEDNPSACEDARLNLQRHQQEQTVVKRNAVTIDVGEYFADVILLDPPRGGSGPLVERLTMGRPRAFVFVSCNARMLAPDLRHIRQAGYRIDAVHLCDMFPLTSHVETLVLAQRGDQAPIV